MPLYLVDEKRSIRSIIASPLPRPCSYYSRSRVYTWRQAPSVLPMLPFLIVFGHATFSPLVAGAWTERKKMFHGGSFLKLADDNMDIQNPEAQNRELAGF